MATTVAATHGAATPPSTATFESLRFDNTALRKLPLDDVAENYTRSVPGAVFSRLEPTPIKDPVVVVASAPALELLGLDAATQLARPDAAAYLCGNKLLPGAEPAAHCYCGHQFGAFSGQLGDGAAMYMGEVINAAGERWELQLKGAGLTPYSRTADGRKVLRSSIREFLASEHMAALGVPTTRSGSCVTSSTLVVRDIFYTGEPIRERATVITRVAPTFLRFGSFEVVKLRDPLTGRAGPSFGQTGLLDTLLDFTQKTYFPECAPSGGGDAAASDPGAAYIAMFGEIVRRTARLVAHWQAVGFCHGVLNTDNMSVVGVTLDYGPYQFMDRFQSGFVCNNSDNDGRYAYDAQVCVGVNECYVCF